MSVEDRGRHSKGERHELILSQLNAAPTLRVSEIAAELGVSTETIRRDLDELTDRGLINRTYGGAVRPMGAEPALSQRHQLMIREREAIAAAVSTLISANEVIAIGAGATTLHVARKIAASHRDITVITHSFGVATVLAINPTIAVLLCPGRYNGREGCVAGIEAADYLSRFNVNRAIVGATGITADGPNEVDPDAAAVYRAMIERASEAVVVADHGKFGVPALSVYARWSSIATLATDAAPPPPLARVLKSAGVGILLAKPR
ncbi:MAG: DeoR/GlpR family DNA-binding transcription regulator [Pseudorhodoplanes sp.]